MKFATQMSPLLNCYNFQENGHEQFCFIRFRSACRRRYLLRLLQDHVRLEVRASLRVQPEVQGGKVHHWIGSHDQRKWMGKWKLIVTTDRQTFEWQWKVSDNFVLLISFLFHKSVFLFRSNVQKIEDKTSGRYSAKTDCCGLLKEKKVLKQETLQKKALQKRLIYSVVFPPLIFNDKSVVNYIPQGYQLFVGKCFFFHPELLIFAPLIAG